MHSTLSAVETPKVPVPTHSVWRTSIRFTLVTTVLLGLGYPLLVTAIAGVAFPHKAAGSLILKDGQVIGSELLAQSFNQTGDFRRAARQINLFDMLA